MCRCALLEQSHKQTHADDIAHTPSSCIADKLKNMHVHMFCRCTLLEQSHKQHCLKSHYQAIAHWQVLLLPSLHSTMTSSTPFTSSSTDRQPSYLSRHQVSSNCSRALRPVLQQSYSSSWLQCVQKRQQRYRV